MAKRKKSRTLNLIITAAVATVTTIAVVEQLRRPANERTWQGDVFGIPYNFRIPSLSDLQEGFWNKDTTQVITPRTFGVGWSINFYALSQQLVQQLFKR